MTTYPPPVSIGNRAANWQSKESRNIQTAPQALHWELAGNWLSLSLDDSLSVSSCEFSQSSCSANPSAGDMTQYATVKRGELMQLTYSVSNFRIKERAMMKR